ncbi:MAG: aminoglycoside phosphotransferase family protein [Ruminococcus sp.]|nr:aminoglycoside phosphotransferase family protein [Ruminococcus sp.]
MDIGHAAGLFGAGSVHSYAELKSGHINQSFLLECSGGRYILQSLNRDIFKYPEIIAENTELILKAFSENLDCGVQIPVFLEHNGSMYLKENGEIWRMYSYIEPTGEYSAYMHGFAVGRFLKVLNSGDMKLKVHMKLHEFDLPLPMRNIHGDTKADNVIFGESPAVIDLDTASRGYAFVDFGDMLRSVTSEVFDIQKISAAVSGFAEGAGGLLTDDEIDTLYDGTLLIISELLERYREGIKNFPNKSPEQCLERQRQLATQIDDFRTHEDEISSIVRTIFGKGNK